MDRGHWKAGKSRMKLKWTIHIDNPFRIYHWYAVHSLFKCMARYCKHLYSYATDGQTYWPMDIWRKDSEKWNLIDELHKLARWQSTVWWLFLICITLLLQHIRGLQLDGQWPTCSMNDSGQLTIDFSWSSKETNHSRMYLHEKCDRLVLKAQCANSWKLTL